MRRLVPPLAVAACALGLAAPAGAALVTVGPTLDNFKVEKHAGCESEITCEVAMNSTSYVSPVDGEIITWRVKGASGILSLKTLAGNKGSLSSAAVTPSGTGKEVFPTEIPVKAGERIGLGMVQKGNKVGASIEPGAKFGAWSPILAPGEERAPNEEVTGGQLLYNATIRPAPTIAEVTPSSGPVGTANTVTIVGTDFEKVSEVWFGAFPVPFEEVSESAIVAHPSGEFGEAVTVTVFSRSGTVGKEAAYTFEEPAKTQPTTPVIPPVVIPPGDPIDIPPTTFPKEAPECHVPKLKGKSLAQAKRVLVAAHCKLGKVTKRKGVKATSGKVAVSIPPAGARAGDGWPVKVTLR